MYSGINDQRFDDKTPFDITYFMVAENLKVKNRNYSIVNFETKFKLFLKLVQK